MRIKTIGLDILLKSQKWNVSHGENVNIELNSDTGQYLQ